MRITPFVLFVLTACGNELKSEHAPDRNNGALKELDDGGDHSEDNDDFDAQAHGEDKPEETTPTEAWSSQDDPTLFDDNLVFDVDELPMEGEAERVPWAGSYWPVYKDSINHRWDGEDSMSPSEKYAEAFGVPDFPDLVSKHHGIDNQDTRTACSTNDDCNSAVAETCAKREGSEGGYCIPTWWGICHAWAPVAILLCLTCGLIKVT